jgi:hypothetical protein
MSIVYTRTGTPVSGKQGEALDYFKRRAAAIKANYGVDCEVKVRLGGPVGQVILVSRLKDAGELEAIKRRVVADTLAGKMPTAPAGVMESGEDAVWMDV